MAALRELDRSIEGRVTLVTGAASGMGEATAKLFADQGAHVAVTDLKADAVERVVDEIVAAGGSAHGWVLDVTRVDQVGSVVDAVVERWGGLDHLVNNAGISRFDAIESDTFPDVWAVSLDVLLTAHVTTVRAALPHLRASDAGRIVNIASTEGWGATRFGAAYTAAKHGVIGLTKSLAVEFGRQAITVNCVCPGPIRTAMTEFVSEADKVAFAKRRTALGRYGEPEEVAHATLNFCLPASSYMTGAILPVDGGLLIRNA